MSFSNLFVYISKSVRLLIKFFMIYIYKMVEETQQIKYRDIVLQKAKEYYEKKLAKSVCKK